MKRCIRCNRILSLDDIQPHGRCDDCEQEGREIDRYEDARHDLEMERHLERFEEES